MHILNITLNNFRSYRQQAELKGGLSPGANAIVGRNGSGKSNWLNAVQFCLGLGPYAQLSQQERASILHEGSGRAVTSAFVEVLLDNSQHRLAVDSTTVSIRRTIGWKKDEFFLNRQRATKQEITSYLEGAGFSKQNPYYIVQQGKVQQLCVMSDVERLKLLQGVAGTVLYDEKKRDSITQMHDNQARLDQVEALLQEMQEKLSELESEKEELQAYQKYDRQRRALSYALYEKECAKAKRQLEQIEEERQSHLQGTLQKLYDEKRARQEEISRLETLVMPAEHAEYKRWGQILQRARKQFASAKAALQTHEDKLRSAKELLHRQEQERESNKVEAAALQEKLKRAQADLENGQPQHDQAQQTLASLEEERTRVEETIQGLYAKQGRAQQFESVEDRDAFLQSQIDALQKQIRTKEQSLNEQRNTLKAISDKQSQQMAIQVEIESELAQKSKHLELISKALKESQGKKLRLQTERSAAWGRLDEAQSKLKQANDAFQKAKSLKRNATPRAIHMGLEELPKLVEKLRFTKEQYFGTVLENFTLQNDTYQTCVEMAAQNALFNVIVDCEETSSILVEELQKRHAGRVTFLPLSQLRPEQHDVRVTKDGVTRMLATCLQYDPAVDAAMQHVFGQKWVTASFDTANEVCRQFHVDVLTLNGELCSRKGALTGGHVDPNKSRIAAFKRLRAAEVNYKGVVDEHKAAENSVAALQEEWEDCQKEVHRNTVNENTVQRQKEVQKNKLEACKSQQDTLGSDSQQVSEVIKHTEQSLEMSQAELARLQSELGSPLETNLSTEDEHLLKVSKERLAAILRDDLPKAKSAVAKLSLEQQKLRLEQQSIAERLDQLNGSGKRGKDDGEEEEQVDEEKVLELQQTVDEAKIALESAETDQRNANKSFGEAKKKYTASKQQHDTLNQEEENSAKALEEAHQKAERLVNKRSTCISSRETYQRKIQELGSLPPPGELEKYADKTISELMKNLENVNRKLKEYSHVNKKAYDQYVNFSEQREALLKRKKELDQGAHKVKELIDSLDRQKDEAINRTFRGVSKHFTDVFKELVPSGAGELIMRTAADGEDEQGMNEEDQGGSVTPKKIDPRNPDVSLYRGIGIKVRFSAVGENYMMSQLSGGQKALVALALIFAIQRCDPAPFYLFDELDQALDSSYRAAVAAVIQRQANDEENPTQFIVTTFRPELVKIAKKCFGVSLQNKVSEIHHLSVGQALSFVANLMRDEEAVGNVSSIVPSTATTRQSTSRKRKSSNMESSKEKEHKGDFEGDEITATSPQAA